MRLKDKTTDSLTNSLNNQGFPGDIDFTSLSFILQNLRIGNEDIHSDPTLTITSRDYISRSTCLQICFYISLALKSFKRPPVILLFGAGHTGSILVDLLISFELNSCLRIFARGDYATKYWKGRKLHASSSLPELLKESKADIVIMCSGMSSFGFICRSLGPFISRATFFISSCFGLSRKRIFNSLRTPNIFRTFQEPMIASIKRDSAFAHDEGSVFDCNASAQSFMDVKSGETNAVEGLNTHELTFEQQSADLILRRCPKLCNMIYLLENYYALRGMSPSTARNESINSLLGSDRSVLATKDKLRESQGSGTSSAHVTIKFKNMGAKGIEECVADQCLNSKISCDGFESVKYEVANSVQTVRTKQKKEVKHAPVANALVQRENCLMSGCMDPTGLLGVQKLFQDRVACHFQKHFSKSIRVADIPEDFELGGSMESANEVELMPTGEGKRGDLLPAEIEERNCLNPSITSGRRESHREHFNGPSVQEGLRESGACIRTTFDLPEEVCEATPNGALLEISKSIVLLVPETDLSLGVNTRFSQLPSSESDYNTKMRELEELRIKTKAKILDELDSAPKIKEPIGEPMHSDEELLLIFAEDSLIDDDGGFRRDSFTATMEGSVTNIRQTSEQRAELVSMLNEIDAEEDKHPNEQSFSANGESNTCRRKDNH